VKERLVALWHTRFEACRAAGDFKELETFGWRFGSGQLDSDWALAELLATLRVTKRIDPDFLVLEKLRTLAPTRPQEVVECLRHIGRRRAGALGTPRLARGDGEDLSCCAPDE
jgi:hypothetical protein